MWHQYKRTQKSVQGIELYAVILYFVWEDQSDAMHRIVHTVLISIITVLYESYRTIMQLIGQTQYSYAENLFKECYENNTLNC